MGKRGPPKGSPRVGGRRKGKKNKLTIERELRAAQAAAVIDGGRHKELAVDVLHRLMTIADWATALHRPPSPDEIEAAELAGRTIHPGDWDRFGEWFDRTEMSAKDLAKYQSPTFRAVAVLGADLDKGTEVRFVIENAPAMIEAVATEV